MNQASKCLQSGLQVQELTHCVSRERFHYVQTPITRPLCLLALFTFYGGYQIMTTYLETNILDMRFHFIFIMLLGAELLYASLFPSVRTDETVKE